MEEPEVMLRRMEHERVLRCIMYAALVASGAFATLDPSTLVSRQVSELTTILWSICMTVSAFICLLGAITDRWIGEFTGLPLLASVLAFYGLTAMMSFDISGGIVIAYGLTCIAFSAGLVARWSDVRKIRLSAIGGKDGEGD